ncbi:MAG: putative transposase [Egibacteraceae bacterium]
MDGLRSLLLTMVFAMLIGQPRAEGLRRIDPADLGRLIGLDRAPEPKTLRRRVGELAAQGKADQLLVGLARHHIDARADAVGIFYVDGHVRAWHGKHDVPKHHLARMRLSMPAEEDIWIGDACGDGILVWQAPAAASLVGELRQVAKSIRKLVGADRRPTICFDRGGRSPKLFAQLGAAGFDVLTYRKGEKTPEPDDAFREYTLTDDRGRPGPPGRAGGRRQGHTRQGAPRPASFRPVSTSASATPCVWPSTTPSPPWPGCQASGPPPATRPAPCSARSSPPR